MAADNSPSRATATRARLVASAVQAFSEKGFHGTTTRDIAEASGLSSAALYVHHKSKEELLYLISRTGHEETLQLVQAARNAGGPPSAQLRRLVHDFVTYHAREHATARVVNYELGALDPAHQREIRRIRRRIDDEVQQVIAAGVASGDFRTPDPRMAAVALQSLGIDVARWYDAKGAWSPHYIAARYAEMALRLVDAR
jgi:AcrR family transcriptional regulator